jgi:copper chaperone CopZ
MMEEIGPAENARRAVREPGPPHRVERLLIVRPRDGADVEGANSELEGLPGVVRVAINAATGSFDIVFDPMIVSDEELAAALHYQGFDLNTWQEVRAMHAPQQRMWLLEQIQSLAARGGHEVAKSGTYAAGVTMGSVDAYVRAARAFGLVTDAEIVQLIPPRSLEGPD